MNEWQQLTWEEIGALVNEGNQSALLPVGATEQHGPQLGCGVDSVIAEKVCKAVAQKTAVHLLPTLAFGCSIGHSKRWPGTLALQPKTLIDVVHNIGEWAYASGIRKLFIINGHVTNFAPLRCALEMLRASYDDLMVALINTPEISERVKARHYADAEDWHANEAETSLMMAIAPELVRAEKVVVSDDADRTVNSVFSHPVNHTSLNGVTGNPSEASLALGQQLFEWMVEDLALSVEKGKAENAPLDASYFTSCC